MEIKEEKFIMDNLENTNPNKKKNNNSIKKGLGRGLSSLLGDSSDKIVKNRVSIKDLSRNKFQPRKHFSKDDLEDLTNSIKEQGVIQPIVVRPNKQEEGKYEIIAGERRWLASQNAGLNEVPVVILNVDDVKSLEIAIIENVQRQNLNPVEEAKGYKKLVNDFNYDQEKLAKFIGKSRSYIANSLRLISLPKDVLLLIESGSISAGHGRTLIGLNNCSELAKEIVKKKLSVRQSEFLSQKWKGKKYKLISKKDANILDLQKTLEEKIGLSVSINNKKNNSGAITFNYHDLGQLDRLVKIIKNNY